MRRVRISTIALEKQYVLNIMGVLLALVTQHAMRIRHIVICGLPRSARFFHIIS